MSRLQVHSPRFTANRIPMAGESIRHSDSARQKGFFQRAGYRDVARCTLRKQDTILVRFTRDKLTRSARKTDRDCLFYAWWYLDR